jgi:AcrR family transcriptional regulator
MVKGRTAVKRANRPYQSAVRDAQAQATRLAIIDAASRLFAERGYASTSIDAVAEAAGVGRATVFTSVGGKAALLKAAYDVAIVGDDEPVPLPERPWARPVRDEPDPRRMLDLYAGMVTEVCRRVASIYDALRAAAHVDDEVRSLFEAIQAERHGGAANVIAMVKAKGGDLRDDLTADEAADLVWTLVDPGLYHQLVLQRGWQPDRYRSWLAETLLQQLLKA